MFNLRIYKDVVDCESACANFDPEDYDFDDGSEDGQCFICVIENICTEECAGWSPGAEGAGDPTFECATCFTTELGLPMKDK